MPLGRPFAAVSRHPGTLPARGTLPDVLMHRPGSALRAPSVAPALAAVLVATLLGGCGPVAEVVPAGSLAREGPVASWPAYGSDAGGTRFSPLTQIDTGNVAALERAWVQHTGDVVDGSDTLLPGSFQATPILVGDALVLCTPRNHVVALDAGTGALRWRFDPQVDTRGIYVIACRGVSAWRDPEAAADAACRARIFTGTLDGRLIALDAATGRPCAGFGRDGEVDLREGIGDVRPGEYGVTSPPAILGDRVVVGTMVLDNRRLDAPGGVVRAFDARSGALRWAWDPIPPDAEVAMAAAPADGPGDASVRYRRGTTNAWSVLSVDAARDLVFVPTGNTSPDYYGGLRHGLDGYSSSLVALRGDSGEVAWHFQTVHHDVWDYDVPSQPVLVDLPTPQGPRAAVVQATKPGHVFVLDRETGEPLLPVEERAVPVDGVAGETLAPTQPFPVRPPPVHPARLSADDAFGFTPWDRGHCREIIAGARSEGVFTPPSLQGSIQFPGMAGGSNWGSLAVDPVRGIAVTPTTRVATYIRLIPREDFERQFPDGAPAYGFEPQAGTPYALERRPLLSPLGAPCNPPPWGALTAIDLVEGEILWEVPLGTTRDLAPWPFWMDTGTPLAGGAIVTAGGLVFVGATTDHFLRAFDLETGEELWKGRLPVSGHATPMTYRLSETGRQLVVIAAGGHGLMGGPVGDSVVAFALPEKLLAPR